MQNNKLIYELTDLHKNLYKESSVKSYDPIDHNLLIYLNSISKKDIEKQYLNYRFKKITNLLQYNIVSPILKENESGEYINKNRTLTVDPKTVQKDICNLFGLSDCQFTLVETANNTTCILYIPDIDINVELLQKSMLQLGWHLGRCMSSDPYNKKYAILKFEPLYNIDITNEIHKLNYIYHISSAYNYKSIKKYGFIPQHKNDLFTYPNRIYFIKDNEYVNKSYFIEVILELYKASNKNTTNYLVYKLDVNKIPYKVKFQDDPNIIQDSLKFTTNINFITISTNVVV